MFAVLDKPAGITSRDAVDHAQAWFPRVKLGHAGTLDPGATGVLVLAVGPTATRLIEYVQRQEKVYRSTFRLGATSTTDDADGEITPSCGMPTVGAESRSPEPPTRERLDAALRQFLGTIEQVPPAFSAARVQGVRAYTKARRGQLVALSPRPVTLHRLDLLRYEYPEIDLEITCGKGTYIRSLARDLGQRLGVGGYVATLRRTRIGSYTLEHAIPWDAPADEARTRLLPDFTAVADLQQLQLTDEQLVRLRQGQTLAVTQALSQGEVALVHREVLAGIAEVDSGCIRPVKMFVREVNA